MFPSVNVLLIGIMRRFIEHLERMAAQSPDKLALCQDDTRLTYSDLLQRTASLAAFLQDQGLGPGATLGFLRTALLPGYLMVLACLRLGVNVVYVDARDNPEKTRQVFTHARIDLLISEVPAPENAIPPACRNVLFPERLPASEKWLAPVISAESPAWIEPTSGSTGAPKLVQVNRATLGHYLRMQTEKSHLTQTARVAVLNEMWLDVTLSGLCAGASVHLFDLRKHGAFALAEWLRAERITALQTFLAAFRALADATRDTLPDLTVVKLAGEALTRADVESFTRICPSNAVLMNFYGSTELSLVCQFDHPHAAPLPNVTLPVGKPIPGTEVQLLDEKGDVLEPGLPGQIRVIADHMASGYLNNPEKSAGVYARTPDGRFSLTTGDLGRFDEQGNLIILGRIDDQIKIRGYSVRIGEVEQALRALPGVAEAAVTTTRSPHGVLQLVAHYQPDPMAQTSAKVLRAGLAQNYPAYMVPSYFVVHKALPRTDTGKILRRALPDPLSDPTKAPTHDFSSEDEKTIAKIWEEILGHTNFVRDDDFFDVGGDSLQAMSMVLKVEHNLKQRVGYESLILHGASIGAIANRLKHKAHAGPQGMLLLRKGRTGGNVYIMPVENGEFSDWLYVLKEMEYGASFYGVHVRDPAARDRVPRQTVQQLGQKAAQDILRHDPDGPHILLGYSSGTQLAIEAARALRAFGKNIAGLLLVDPPVPWLEPYYRGWRSRRILAPALKHRNYALTLNRAGHILFGLPARELDVADETQFWTYRPKPLVLSATFLVTATEESPNLEQKLLFWQGILGKDVANMRLKANHQHIMRAQNAPRLAHAIDKWLQRIAPDQ